MAPSPVSAAAISSVSGERSGRRTTERPGARAARTSARLVTLLEPGRATSARSGPLARGAGQGSREAALRTRRRTGSWARRRRRRRARLHRRGCRRRWRQMTSSLPVRSSATARLSSTELSRGGGLGEAGGVAAGAAEASQPARAGPARTQPAPRTPPSSRRPARRRPVTGAPVFRRDRDRWSRRDRSRSGGDRATPERPIVTLGDLLGEDHPSPCGTDDAPQQRPPCDDSPCSPPSLDGRVLRLLPLAARRAGLLAGCSSGGSTATEGPPRRPRRRRAAHGAARRRPAPRPRPSPGRPSCRPTCPSRRRRR